jgi:hypothetical protein
MSSALRRPPRWSKKTDLLVQYVAHRCRPGLQAELGEWIENSPRFGAFVSANQDKVRKKLSTSDDQEHRLDVRAELLVAALLVADRRFEVGFEAYGARRLGPDLTVTFRANQRFNLEVTRLRPAPDAGDAGTDLIAAQAQPGNAHNEPGGPPSDPAVARLANIITGKVRQLPGESPNALLLAARGLSLTEITLVAAMRLLKLHADRKNDAYFARRGLKDARDFYARYLRLGGVFVLDEASAPRRAIFAPNREARHPLSSEVVTLLLQCLSAMPPADGGRTNPG